MSTCSACVYWSSVDRNRSYLGKCTKFDMSTEFNFSCKSYTCSVLPVGETLSPEKLNIGYHPYANFGGLSPEEYYKEIQ